MLQDWRCVLQSSENIRDQLSSLEKYRLESPFPSQIIIKQTQEAGRGN